MKEFARAIKFALFSISAGVIELAAFSLLDTVTGWDYWPCYLIALILSVLWNFTLNRQYTFRSAGNVPRAMALVAGFYCVFTPVSTVLGNYLAETLGWNGLAVTVLNMGGQLCPGISLRPVLRIREIPGYQCQGRQTGKVRHSLPGFA